MDEQLRAAGFRGRLLPPDADPPAPRKHRSTRRRQDAPDLPRHKVTKTTVGQVYAGKFQPSMFVTLTLPGYGKVLPDGTPVRPDSYDYRQAARDIVHFAALFDRWVQNLRGAVGWNVQYFTTVEPQRRGAPHLHIALRGAIPRDTIRAVTAATYHQVWWPEHNQPVYTGEYLPIWDQRLATFTDPNTSAPLTGWDDALDELDGDEDAEPAHMVRFGTQVDIKGILGGTEESGRHIGYLTKYLTKSIGEILNPDTDRQHAHHHRLHAELEHTPCSPRCPVWLRYGIVPLGATSKTTPGRCKAKAHRRATLGLPGRRVLVSRKWSGKTLPDHRADREAFVRQLLTDIGITKPTPDPGRYTWDKVRPGDSDYEGLTRLYVIPGLGKRKLKMLEAKHIRNWPAGLRSQCQCCEQKKDEQRAAKGRARCCALASVQCCRQYPSTGTLRAILRMVRAALQDAVEEELLSRNVARQVPMPKGVIRKTKPWSAAETQKFLVAAREDRLYALWAVALTIGLRRGEALGLRWTDVDLVEGRVPRNINRAFAALCRRAEVRLIRLHDYADLRHSCATLLFTMGEDAATVQRILRHSSIEVTTSTYLEVIEQVQRKAVSGMDRLLDVE